MDVKEIKEIIAKDKIKLKSKIKNMEASVKIDRNFALNVNKLIAINAASSTFDEPPKVDQIQIRENSSTVNKARPKSHSLEKI